MKMQNDFAGITFVNQELEIPNKAARRSSGADHGPLVWLKVPETAARCGEVTSRETRMGSPEAACRSLEIGDQTLHFRRENQGSYPFLDRCTAR
mmetsp:Transcript_147885/g.210022  ORF Transcript_147885/g.210022 Transcript_147885/m.210022 type:complete len:94 (+) Transcript_147885:1482-1763(+)